MSNNEGGKIPVDLDEVVNVPMRRGDLDYVLQVLALRPYGEVVEVIERIARAATPGDPKP